MNKKFVSIIITSVFILTTIFSINSVNATSEIITKSVNDGSADLEATAFTNFIWNGVRPNAERTNILYIRNEGDPGSELSWRIEVIYVDLSDTGWITCSPSSGAGLEPEEGEFPVTVTVYASPDKSDNRRATIKAINCDDESDYRVFDVQIGTTAKITSLFKQSRLLGEKIFPFDFLIFVKQLFYN